MRHTRSERAEDSGWDLARKQELSMRLTLLSALSAKRRHPPVLFVSTHELLKSYFLNSSRSFIFFHSIASGQRGLNSEHMILKLLTMDKEREHLIEISDKFRSGIEEITGQPNNSRSHIVPLIVGDAHKAMLTASKLSLKGIDAFAHQGVPLCRKGRTH